MSMLRILLGRRVKSYCSRNTNESTIILAPPEEWTSFESVMSPQAEGLENSIILLAPVVPNIE